MFRLMFLISTFCVLPSSFAQAPPQRDPQAIQILTRALNTAGGPALGAVQDFTASGTITYFWAGQEIKGTATLRGRGLSHFRLDADLPDGRLSLATDGQTGILIRPDGVKQAIAAHTSLKLGGLTFLFPRLIAALADAGTSVSYLGEVARAGSRLHRIEIDREGLRPLPKGVTSAAFLVDSTTFVVASLEDHIQPENNAGEDFSRAVSFEDYRAVQGVLVPFLITERIEGQRMWVIQLDSISFNRGLADSDFRP